MEKRKLFGKIRRINTCDERFTLMKLFHFTLELEESM